MPVTPGLPVSGTDGWRRPAGEAAASQPTLGTLQWPGRAKAFLPGISGNSEKERPGDPSHALPSPQPNPLGAAVPEVKPLGGRS